MTEKAGSALILEQIMGQVPQLSKIFSDAGYEGKDFAQSVKDNYYLDWEMVKRDKQSKGFKVLPCLPPRKLFIYAAMVRFMVRRLA